MSSIFVLEQTLGHVTHSLNLKSLVPLAGGVAPTFVDVDFAPGRDLPLWSNWTIRAGVRARRGLAKATGRRGGVRADVLFVHTQVPAVLLGRWMRRIPTVVSLDATPTQYDELGEFYAHGTGPAWVERQKHRANRRCYERAAHIITWSEWAKHGLVDEYAVDPRRITVIAPGVDVSTWSPPAQRAGVAGGPVQILFVGGDLPRKGGDTLIDAVRRVRRMPDLPEVELHLVTTASVDPEPGVVVHHGLTSNSPGLIERYHQADLFCLPTLGDCLPMVLAEAAAAELPLVSTDVGAIREIVRPGETGELVRPRDVEGLAQVLAGLVADGERRRRLGAAAARLAAESHDARRNAARIVQILQDVAVGATTSR